MFNILKCDPAFAQFNNFYHMGLSVILGGTAVLVAGIKLINR